MSKMELPTKKREIKRINPRKLIIYSKPKVGKTTICAALENSVLLELERAGGDFVEGAIEDIGSLGDLMSYGNKLKEFKDATGEYPYTYVIIDTITKLEELVLPYAAKLYRETPMGRNWTGKDVTSLPNGAGYRYLRKAFFDIIDEIETWAPNIILLGHLKDTLIEKKGEELSAMELDLTGKIKSMVSADADAIGYLYRKDNATMINFNASDQIVCGARSPHLKGKDFSIAESDEEGNLEVFWNKIYLPE